MRSGRYTSLRGVLVLIVGLMAGRSPAHADLLRIFFIVEEPLIESELPPPSERFEDIQALRKLHDLLFRRLKLLNIEGHVLVDGRSAIGAKDADKANKADFIVQIIITASRPGYEVIAKLYNAANKSWVEITRVILDFQPLQALEKTISEKVFPSLLMRILEGAQPTNRRILLADCLTPASANEDEKTAARLLSRDYGNSLKTSQTLSDSFSVVALINTADPGFYNLWCLAFEPPRYGVLREDTLTIWGSIDSIRATQNSPAELFVSIQASGLGRNLPPKPLITLYLDHLADPNVVETIKKQVEEVTNGPR
jgi:hypothetical protein